MTVEVTAKLSGERPDGDRYRSAPTWDYYVGIFDVDVTGLVPIEFIVPANATSFNLEVSIISFFF